MAPEMIPVRRSEDRCRSGIPVLQLRNRISALLVDSDRSSQIAQSSFLRYYGVDTQTASNGLSAFVPLQLHLPPLTSLSLTLAFLS